MKEYRPLRETEAWKWIRTAFQVALIIAVIAAVVFLFQASGISETDVTEAYVLCTDYVNVRPYPNRKGDEIGRFECGTRIWLDGRKKNGYLHIVDAGLESDGWVYAGYVVYDKPEKMSRSAVIVSKGRLAARKYVKGRRTRWLKPLAALTVYAWSDEWCVTNCGYVQTRYLELEGE